MEGAFLYLLDRSAGAGIVFAAVLLARFLLRDAPKTFRMILWGVLAFRLLCPYAPESRLSLMPDPEPVRFESAVPEAIPVLEDIPAFPADMTPYPVPVSEASAPAPTPLQILSAVWFSGLCALLAWSLYGYLKVRRTVSASLPLRDGARTCDDIAAPFVLGVLRPRVYVPSGIPDAELSFILAHEHAHIRRGDPVWKLCAWLVTCLYWFHPLVWLSYALFCRDMELACDEAAVRNMDASRRAAYSETLLHCGLRRRKLQVCPLAFGETGVKERVRAVLRYRKPAFWLTGLAVCVCIAAAACFLTRPVSSDTVESPNTEGGKEPFLWVLLSRPVKADTAELSSAEGGKEPLLWVRNNADADWPNVEKTRQSAEFPGVTFRWTPERVTATDADGVETVLFEGMPVWSVYFADLNGDGYSELCSMVSVGSGIIDERIIVYDYKAGRKSELQDRGHYNYTLSEENGTLTARQTADGPYAAPLITGTLRMTDAGRLLLVPANPDAVGSVQGNVPALSDELDKAVRAAVIAHDKPRYASGEFDAESHVVLDRADSVEYNGEVVPVVTLYLMSLRESFDYDNGRFESVSGRSGPVALTFRMEDGVPVLSEYWEPRDGADYWPDLRKKFPSGLSDRELNTQTWILRQNQELYRQVVEHWRIDATPILDALFDELMEPSASSNPGDYLDAHPLALRELLYYDAYARTYIEARIGAEKGLRGALMGLVLQRLQGSAADLSGLGTLSHASLSVMSGYAGLDPGTYALSDPEKLSKLAEMLRKAEPVTKSACPFENVLTLTDRRGESVQLMMAADSCALCRYNGQYYRYGADNSAFYALFGSQMT
ncbi:MAG: hypothetical protein IJR54_08345 [Oscillibacter sp.]|nr:hypothetical protein [Oscillibacter sp.]